MSKTEIFLGELEGNYPTGESHNYRYGGVWPYGCSRVFKIDDDTYELVVPHPLGPKAGKDQIVIMKRDQEPPHTRGYGWYEDLFRQTWYDTKWYRDLCEQRYGVRPKKYLRKSHDKIELAPNDANKNKPRLTLG